MIVPTAGKDRGKTGRVLRTEPAKSRVFVEGLNMVKRHQRPRSIKDTQKSAQAGGIIEKEGPIHVSNVMLLNPADNKPTRVGVRYLNDGSKELYAKKSKARIRLLTKPDAKYANAAKRTLASTITATGSLRWNAWPRAKAW